MVGGFLPAFANGAGRATVTGACQQSHLCFYHGNQALMPRITEIFGCVGGCLTGVKGPDGNLPSSVMMGMFAPVMTEVCLTNPCTGLFSGDDLSIPGGVKPAQAQKTETNQLLAAAEVAVIPDGSQY